MRITRSVKIWRGNMRELEKLDCLAFVKTDDKDPKQITCRIKDGMTQGSPVAHTDDFLVQYETGLWQRFGANAHASLVFNPGKQSGVY